MQKISDVPVNMVTWFLTEQQERTMVLRGIADKPTPEVMRDAQILYDFIKTNVLPNLHIEVCHKV
jgi:hypothetical protein